MDALLRLQRFSETGDPSWLIGTSEEWSSDTRIIEFRKMASNGGSSENVMTKEELFGYIASGSGSLDGSWF